MEANKGAEDGRSLELRSAWRARNGHKYILLEGEVVQCDVSCCLAGFLSILYANVLQVAKIVRPSLGNACLGQISSGNGVPY